MADRRRKEEILEENSKKFKALKLVTGITTNSKLSKEQEQKKGIPSISSENA